MLMYCIGILDSGNYAYRLCEILERKGYVFEVMATPCQIASNGCGYCIKFPEEYKDLVITEGKNNGLLIREIYRLVPLYAKNRYERIY